MFQKRQNEFLDNQLLKHKILQYLQAESLLGIKLYDIEPIQMANETTI